MTEVVQSIDVEAPIEAIWAEITKVDVVQRPLLDTVLRTTFEPGEPLRYTTPDGKRTFVVGRITEVRKPVLFSHTYRLTTSSDPPTSVVWTLEDLGTSHVRVSVRHSGWPEGAKSLDAHSKTWARILSELRNVIESGDVSGSTKIRYALMKAFMWAMPARTMTENVEVPR